MTNYLQMFERYLVEKKAVSANTLESYLRDVRQYLEHIDEDVIKTDEITVESYVLYLKEKNKSPATITRMVASIRAFYQFLMMESMIEENPAKNVKLERTEKKPPQVLTSKEVLTLLSTPNVAELKGARDKAMLELLYATGIRVSELIGLNVSNIRNAKNGRKEILCSGAKGTRTLPMHTGASKALTFYLNSVRPLLAGENSGDSLFINLNGARLTRQGFWKIVKNYTEIAHIEKDITPHTLRHSFAIHLYENGASLHDLQEMLGHADISSTQMYANMSQQVARGDVYERCHPLAAKK